VKWHPSALRYRRALRSAPPPDNPPACVHQYTPHVALGPGPCLHPIARLPLAPCPYRLRSAAAAHVHPPPPPHIDPSPHARETRGVRE
jgi:hypothetical protein